jgi:hypothetical protein
MRSNRTHEIAQGKLHSTSVVLPFWHFLNPDAFPIADRRVKDFFDLGRPKNSVDLYLDVMKKFREFSLSHEDWIPSLRQVDKFSCPAWNDNKLWDKMCYGSREK